MVLVRRQRMGIHGLPLGIGQDGRVGRPGGKIVIAAMATKARILLDAGLTKFRDLLRFLGIGAFMDDGQVGLIGMAGLAGISVCGMDARKTRRIGQRVRLCGMA